MKELLFVFVFSAFMSSALFAQNEEPEVKKGFKKENLFTGGSISVSFSDNAFLIGGSPVLGYNLTKWADAGVVVNYNYTSYRDYQVFDDKLRQYVYGGGVFTRIFPVRFLFAQAQVEHNFIKLKYLPPNGGSTSSQTVEANSVLVGGGYATGRYPGAGNAYFSVAILFDVAKTTNSPYTDGYGRSIPIIRAGVNIPLFQGSRSFEEY
jgi:hypothetical protein